MKHITTEFIRERLQKVAQELRVEYSNGPTAPVGEQLDGPAKLLIEVGVKAPRPYGLCSKDAGLSSEQADKAKSQLVNDGLLKEWKGWPHSGSGGHPIFLELLEEGERVLINMGLNPYRGQGKGDFKHWVFQNGYLPVWCSAEGKRFELEYNAGRKQIDFVWWDSYERLNAIEIVASGSAEHNASDAVRCASIEGVYKVCVACSSKELVKSIKKTLSSELLTVQAKIDVVWIGSFWPWRGEGAR